MGTCVHVNAAAAAAAWRTLQHDSTHVEEQLGKQVRRQKVSD
jgi:hypothetical protein